MTYWQPFDVNSPRFSSVDQEQQVLELGLPEQVAHADLVGRPALVEPRQQRRARVHVVGHEQVRLLLAELAELVALLGQVPLPRARPHDVAVDRDLPRAALDERLLEGEHRALPPAEVLVELRQRRVAEPQARHPQLQRAHLVERRHVAHVGEALHEVHDGHGVYPLGVAGREVLAQQRERLPRVRQRHRPLPEVERRDLLVAQRPRVRDEPARRVDLADARPRHGPPRAVRAPLVARLVDVVAAGYQLHGRALRPHGADLRRNRVLAHPALLTPPKPPPKLYHGGPCGRKGSATGKARMRA